MRRLPFAALVTAPCNGFREHSAGGQVQRFRQKPPAKAPSPRIACTPTPWGRMGYAQSKHTLPETGEWRAAARALTKEQTYQMRQQYTCPALSVSYANTDPLMVMSGAGAYLYDDAGAAFLDTRNNVAHLGHQHPAVVAAVQAQVAELNTNTRYLHPNLVLLAERLLATLPSPLAKVFFVNSGSEANDLALRLAWTHTRNRDVVVVDHAYHGHTASTVDISPYKAEGKGGLGLPAWVHKVACPDTYRGPHRGADAGAKYAAEVQDVCARAGRVAAFFVESGMSVGGVILPPEGYLAAAYAAVRAAGGVCVADEVQTGFGRFGTHFWGFQQQHVVPDIVTMGKPFGNGMPLAAVVTTRAVADSFATGMEYFNTFGGNPVVCAAGLAVLETIEQQGLQQHAREVGDYLKAAFTNMSAEFPLIGHVRGAGLFLGVEFVRDRETLEPAAAETSLICSRLKDRHRVLTSIDGPHNNVLVLKPPMCFGQREADAFVDAMRHVMAGLTARDIANAEHTPT